ncbi:MAG: MFS transporter [Firmicutes bacterium]|nr:MFS transporter [Bacillota bacterium]
MNMFSQYKGLPRQVYILSATKGAVNMGMIIVYPFLSLLLTSRFGFSDTEAGLIVVIASAISIIGSIIGGKLADAWSRKYVFLISAAFVSAVMTLAGFWADSMICVLFIMASYLAVNAVLPTISAMILDYSPVDKKTECFSLQYLSSNVGGSIGPVLAGALFYSHTKWIFFSMAIAFFLPLIWVGLGVKDLHHQAKILSPAETQKKEESILSILRHHPVLLIFTGCIALLTLSYINLDFLLPLQLSDSFGLNAGSKTSSLVWTINGLVVITLTPSLIAKTKENHPLFNIAIACIFYVVGLGAYAFADSIPFFLVMILVWTSGEILISTCAAIYIADQTPETHKGRSMALYEFANGMGKLLGPLTSGLLLSRLTYGQVWLCIAVICLVTGLVIAGLYRKSSK